MASVVIHRYLTADGKGVPTAKAHIRYIQHRRDDKERELESDSGRVKRDLFDGERDSLDRRELNALIDKERPGGVAIHKLTLSPGIQDVDLKEYTREVMDALGQEKGLDLIWGAAIHRNTDHDHVHVVVLGSDANGHRVRIDRQDHDLLRFRSDQYLEREHAYDRELEREEREAVRVTQEHGLNRDGDRLGQLLGRVGRDERLQDGEGSEGRGPWSREEAIERLPESQKIQVQGEIYTKYNTKEELERLDEHLKSNYDDRIDKRQYAIMRGWIDAKERNGDDCHENWDRERHETSERKDGRNIDIHRQWQDFDKNARKVFEDQSGVIHRSMTKQQLIFEERGRTSEFHTTYQNSMAKQKLTDARERTTDAAMHRYIDGELEMLRDYQAESLKDLPTIDLDRLYGKDSPERAERTIDTRTLEPGRGLNVDRIEFSDPLKTDQPAAASTSETEHHEVKLDQDHDPDRDISDKIDKNIEHETPKETPEEGAKAVDDVTNEMQEQSRDLTGEQQGQLIHEQTVFKSKLDDREDEPDRSDDRER